MTHILAGLSVIPGRRAAASPESMASILQIIDSGFAPLARPGMTASKLP
jgi:hypothetical protein